MNDENDWTNGCLFNWGGLALLIVVVMLLWTWIGDCRAGN